MLASGASHAAVVQGLHSDSKQTAGLSNLPARLACLLLAKPEGETVVQGEVLGEFPKPGSKRGGLAWRDSGRVSSEIFAGSKALVWKVHA